MFLLLLFCFRWRQVYQRGRPATELRCGEESEGVLASGSDYCWRKKTARFGSVSATVFGVVVCPAASLLMEMKRPQEEKQAAGEREE